MYPIALDSSPAIESTLSRSNHRSLGMAIVFVTATSFTGDAISTPVLDTKCANGNNDDFVLSVSNLPTGDLAVLDATYDYSVVKRNN